MFAFDRARDVAKDAGNDFKKAAKAFTSSGGGLTAVGNFFEDLFTGKI